MVKNDKRKKVFLTGAFGNIGLSTLDELLARDFEVITFDIPRKKNRRIFRKYKKIWGNKITAFWGDLRNYMHVEKAIEDVNAVIHLGAIIPPISEIYPDKAFEVNVGGTTNILKAMELKCPQAQLIFTSSFTVYGNRREDPIISLNDSFNPMSDYANHKIECEKLIKLSRLKWTIIRLTYIPSLNDLKLFRHMYDVPLETKIELCVSKDVALALVNAINNSKALYKIFNAAGGEPCRTTYGEYLLNMFEIFGIGQNSIPAEAFSLNGTFGGWIKPNGEQNVLKYQHTNLDNFYDDLRHKYRIIRSIVKVVEPLAKYIIVKQSPYIQNFKNYQTITEYLNSINENQIMPNLCETPISIEC